VIQACKSGDSITQLLFQAGDGQDNLIIQQ